MKAAGSILGSKDEFSVSSPQPSSTVPASPHTGAADGGERGLLHAAPVAGHDVAHQHQHEQPAQPVQHPGRPWWRTPQAIWSMAAVAIALVLLAVLLPLGLLGYLGHNHKPDQGPHVKLAYATYIGTTLDGGINRFLGMRYAAAPLGHLRWRAPADPPASTAPQQAKAFGSICLGIAAATGVGQDEDCLFVNVWAPTAATPASSLPVWLFIQGGGYTTNANANWDGDTVVRQSGNNIVFVNFNYRVGLWGFLASAQVQADGNLNAGLLDQRFLLHWVKTNIAAFGGDPNNVVIHGASAGAGSVALHLMAYGGRNDNLFSAGIAESVFFPAQPFVPQLEYQFDRLTNATGCATQPGQTPIACLRALDTKTLQAQNIPSVFPGRTQPPLPLFYWTPCIDGDFLQDLPYNLLAQGKFLHLPLLFGDDENEGSYFASNATTSADMVNFFQNNYPLLSADDTNAIVNTYPLLPALPEHNAWFPSTSMAYGEATFTCPAINIMAAYTAATNKNTTSSSSSNNNNNDNNNNNNTTPSPPPLWLYRYNVLDQDNLAAGLGVPHLWESFAVFGPDNLGGQPAPESYLTYNAAVVPLVMAYFLSFVQTHDPNQLRAAGAPTWDLWGTGGGSRIVIETNTSRMEVVDDSQLTRCRFWQGLAPRTQQKIRSVAV